MMTQETALPPAPTSLREERSSLPVIFSGLISSALALVGVYVLDVSASDFHIMGWYADYVLPVGALLVGMVASSGYGLASWFTGVKITRTLLWTVLALQVGVYFAAQYIEFKNLHLVHRGTGVPVGFFEYYDAVARAFAWQQQNGSPGEPLGVFGYFFRLLEVVGFALGGLIAPFALFKAPYCPDCQVYMKTRQLALVPASIKAKKVRKSNVEAKAAYDAEQQQAFDAGKQTAAAVQQLAASNSAADFRSKIEELKSGNKAAARLPGRISIRLVHCKRCHSGQLLETLLVGQGKYMKRTQLARTDLHPEFVRSVTQ